MRRLYRYLGPAHLAANNPQPTHQVRINGPADVHRWIAETHQTIDRAGEVVTTFIIDTQGDLWIADRHSEHVQCARGQPVLSAGEMTFRVTGVGVEVGEVTNQSTGYCPEPESWPAVEAALANAGIELPAGFTHAFTFRRCPDCNALALVKEEAFECPECGSPLPPVWNCDGDR